MAATTSQDLSRRFPRERFTRTLQKLFARVDLQGACQFNVEYTPYLAPTIKGRVEARVTGVWAVGSYARGAITCGDLELLVDVDIRWVGLPTYGGKPHDLGAPDLSSVRRQIFGTYPYVCIHDRKRALDWTANPEPNGRHEPIFTMEAAVPLYGAGLDWQAALAAIPIDVNAGRFPRAHDALPLRLEQTCMHVKWAEELVAAWEAGIIEWTFIPFENRIGLDSELLTAGEAKAAKDAIEFSNKKTLEVMPAALVATRDARTLVLDSVRDELVFSQEAVEFRFGKRSVHPEEFLSLALHTVVIVPHWSARGPNGAWIVTAGPKHPCCFALAPARALTLAGGAMATAGLSGRTSSTRRCRRLLRR